MPFAMAPITHVDVTEAEDVVGKKKRKAKKSKEKGKYKGAKAQSDDLSKMDPNSIEHYDELNLASMAMPAVGAEGVDAYVELATALDPYGANGYLDLTNATSKAYVPTYDEENAIMASYFDGNVAEAEPMPESRPFVEKGEKEVSSRKDKHDTAERDALLAEHAAEKQRKRDADAERAFEKAMLKADALAALEYDVPEKPAKAKKEKLVDPGIAEAEELLDADAAERARRRALRSNDIFAIEARKKFEEEFKAEWGDPGIEEARELLAADKAERQRKKDLRKANRKKDEETAVVVEAVEDASEANDNDDNAAPLTGADT